ncbi:MAG: hypothetical protein HC888_07870 [Candidatus Competibacteraceae bacterium]|nr:hypothetical protein [Candidatus Competibacteraceae bacterium]
MTFTFPVITLLSSTQLRHGRRVTLRPISTASPALTPTAPPTSQVLTFRSGLFGLLRIVSEMWCGNVATGCGFAYRGLLNRADRDITAWWYGANFAFIFGLTLRDISAPRQCRDISAGDDIGAHGPNGPNVTNCAPRPHMVSVVLKNMRWLWNHHRVRHANSTRSSAAIGCPSTELTECPHP